MLLRTRACCAQALVEFALALPLVVIVSLGVLQLAVYAHARDVLTSAAQEGARLSAEEGRSMQDGYARARALTTAGLGNSLDPLSVDGSLDADVVGMHIDAGLRPILPLPLVGRLPLHADASVARERFRPGGD